jgi:hypothetical protein
MVMDRWGEWSAPTGMLRREVGSDQGLGGLVFNSCRRSWKDRGVLLEFGGWDHVYP